MFHIPIDDLAERDLVRFYQTAGDPDCNESRHQLRAQSRFPCRRGEDLVFTLQTQPVAVAMIERVFHDYDQEQYVLEWDPDTFRRVG